MKRALKIILLATVLGVLIFEFHEPLQNSVMQLENQYYPCSRPIIYSIDSFDKRFGISKNDFVRAIREAEQIWEQPAHKQLFADAAATSTSFNSIHDALLGPGRNLKINLIYDARQDATVKLRAYGLTIRDSKESYDALKATYETLQDDYAQQKALFELQVAALKKHEQGYNDEITAWNKHGRVPPQEYGRLDTEKTSINETIAEINQMKDDLNANVDRINALVLVLNRLAATLNIEVARYNEIGSANSREFEEGVYQSDLTGQKIDIYQFDDRAKLVRVLAHELGHALGLEHVANPKAIMYRLNQGANDKLTTDDIAALKERCNIK